MSTLQSISKFAHDVGSYFQKGFNKLEEVVLPRPVRECIFLKDHFQENIDDCLRRVVMREHGKFNIQWYLSRMVINDFGPQLEKNLRISNCATQLHREHQFFRPNDLKKDIESCKGAEKFVEGVSHYASKTVLPVVKEFGKFVEEKMADFADEAWEYLKGVEEPFPRFKLEYFLPKKRTMRLIELRRIDSPAVREMVEEFKRRHRP